MVVACNIWSACEKVFAMRGAFYGYPAHLVLNLRKSKGKLSHFMAQIDLAQALFELRPGLVGLVR